MAGGLQHHPGGARHAAPAPRFALPGTAPTHRPTRLHTAQPDRRLRSVCGRSLSATAFQPPYDPCNVAWLGDDLQQSSTTTAHTKSVAGGARYEGGALATKTMPFHAVVQPPNVLHLVPAEPASKEKPLQRLTKRFPETNLRTNYLKNMLHYSKCYTYSWFLLGFAKHIHILFGHDDASII